MTDIASILLGGNGERQIIMPAKMANRHGMIAGATGTGKTISLQVLAEGFSKLGVPVLLADVKGDLSGLGKPAKPHHKIDERIDFIAMQGFRAQPSPVVFWDLLGNAGHPLRATVTDMGPLLLSNMLELNDTQTGIMYSCFKIADDNGWLLLDLIDLRGLLNWMSEHAKELKGEYGNITSSSIGAIQRGLLVLEEQGAEIFMGEPAINLNDLMASDFSGRGVISILDVTKVMQTSPKLYANFLLWLLSELFETLPEVGDAEKPKFVLFFDEAHLLFEDAPKPLLDKIEQVVRLIRSKGVGVYFISQSPLDIPEDVLGQLGLRIQHALRAFTPKDQKAIKTVAQTFRANPALDTETIISELSTGEALVSYLDLDGAPTIVERTLMCPPESRIGPMSDEERLEQIGKSPYRGRYEESIDRKSAHEMLLERVVREQEEAALKAQQLAEEKLQQEEEKEKVRKSRRESPAQALIKSAARSIGSQVGRQIIRGILGSLLRK